MSKIPSPTSLPKRLVGKVKMRLARNDEQSKQLRQELRDRLLIAKIDYANIKYDIYKDFEAKTEYFGKPGRRPISRD